MNRKSNSIFSISLAFIFASVGLYILDITMNNSYSVTSFIPYNICSFIVFILLYGITLFLFTGELKVNQQNYELLQKELVSCTDSLNDVQSTLDDAVEKKTFELAVINGSLNREIAERIQAEANGLKLRNRCHTILNSAGDGIFGIDTQGKVTFSNQKASELLGWSEEELIGSSHHDLIHHTHQDGSIFPIKECPIYMAYKDGQVHFEADDIFWTKSGKIFSVEYTSTPLMDGKQITGAVVVFKDISKAKKLEKQLDLIVNSAGEGILGIDIDGKVTFMNKAASIMLGWEKEELIGKSHHNHVHHSHQNGDEYKEEDCPILQSCKYGQVHFEFDDVFWTKDGNNFPVEYNSTPIIEGNRLTGAVVVFRDLTAFPS